MSSRLLFQIVIGVILERPAPPPHVAHAALPAEDPNARPQRANWESIAMPGPPRNSSPHSSIVPRKCEELRLNHWAKSAIPRLLRLSTNCSSVKKAVSYLKL